MKKFALILTAAMLLRMIDFLLPPVGSFKYANLNGLYYLLTAAG